MRKTGHHILDRIALIDPRFIEPTDMLAPTDPQEFLDWWWEKQGSVCERCPLAERRTVVVKPDGNAQAKIMVIGEGPGFLEDLTGVPLTGPMELRGSRCGECQKAMICYKPRMMVSPTSRTKKTEMVVCEPDFTPGQSQVPKRFFLRSAGAVLDGILIKRWKFSYPRLNWIEQYNRSNPAEPWTHSSPWYFTNTVMCRSTDVSGTKDQAPESVPRAKCKRHLAFQWAAVEPDIIIAFGRVALTVLLGSETKARQVSPLSIVDSKFGPILFQNHPAYFMREEQLEIRAYGYSKIAEVLARALQHVGLPA